MKEPRLEPAGLSNRVTDLPESTIRKMFALAQQQDEPLVRLEIGEPDFDTPAHIIEAARDAAKGGATHYTHNAGTLELRRAIADEMQRTSGREFDPATEILVSSGAIEAIYTALCATVSSGEEVVLPTPAWPSYFTQASLLDIDLVEVPLSAESGFDLSASDVADAIGSATSAVVLTSPSNPTGQVYEPETIRQIAELASEHDAYVIADEVYEKLVYEDGYRPVVDIVDDRHRDRILTVRSCSKTYAMTGWRIGWLAGPEHVITAGTRLHQGTITCASSVSQQAALAALEGPQEPIEQMRAAFRERRDYVLDRIDEIPGLSCSPPAGGFYVFVDVSAFEGTCTAVAKRLLTEYGVVTVPGTGFGEAGRDHLRLSFATGRDDLVTAFDQIEKMAVAELA